MSENQQKPTDFPVDLAKLREEEERLKAFQGEGHVSPKTTGRMFNAVSLYGVAVDFGIALLLPLLAGVYGGKWLAARTGDKGYVVGGIVLALVVSAVSIYRQILHLKRKMQT